MADFTRGEIEETLAEFTRRAEVAADSGDWSEWSEMFTEDAHYVEHAYGEFQGREAIAKWICEVMSPFPEMTFPQDWVALDEEKGAIVFQCQNRLPHPGDPEGEPFSFPTWTRLVYAGDGLFSSEEDIYNPKHFGEMVQGWMERKKELGG